MRQNIYLGNNRLLTSLHTGHKIFVDTRDVGIAPHLMWEGRWEPWIDHHVLDAVRPGMTVCDVGASFGYYTLLLAEQIGPTGQLHAFEPNPTVARLLKQSVMVNGFDQRVRVHCFALGKEEGELTLHVDEASVGGSFLEALEAIDGFEPLRVPVRRLDQVLKGGEPVHFLKVDVEGFEDAMMQGAGALLEHPDLRGALMEFRRLSDAISDLPRYVAQLLARGMTVVALEPDGPMKLADVGAVMALPKGHLTNLLFQSP